MELSISPYISSEVVIYGNKYWTLIIRINSKNLHVMIFTHTQTNKQMLSLMERYCECRGYNTIIIIFTKMGKLGFNKTMTQLRSILGDVIFSSISGLL